MPSGQGRSTGERGKEIADVSFQSNVFRPFPGESRRRRGASGVPGRLASQNSILKPGSDWVRVRTSFGRNRVAHGTGQGPAQRRPARDAARPRMRRDGCPAAAYTWHVAADLVLVVVDLDCDGWHSVTSDAAGVVADLAELQPDLLARVPLIAYQDSMGCWECAVVAPERSVERRELSTGTSGMSRGHPAHRRGKPRKGPQHAGEAAGGVKLCGPWAARPRHPWQSLGLAQVQVSREVIP
jgi:hypothetical protein